MGFDTRGATGRSVGRALLLAVTVAAALGALDADARTAFDRPSFPVNDFPQGIFAGDCTGDGLPDLLVSDQGSDDVVMLRNVKSGRFAFQTTIPITAAPRAAVCADFDGDGLLDVAAVSRSDGSVTIARRKSEGGYARTRTIPIGNQPNALAAADLNADGAIDLVAVNARSRTMTILFGDGAGNFPLVSTIGFPDGIPTAVAIADFDRDGKLDFAVALRGKRHASSVRIYRGDGLGTFTPLPAQLTVPDPRALAVADIDADGILDVVVLSSDSAVAVYLGSITGRFIARNLFGVAARAQGIALADFDADGLIDLAIVHSDTNSVEILRGTGPAEFESAGPTPSSVVVNAFGAAAARALTNEDNVPSNDVVHVNPVTRALEVVAHDDAATGGVAVAPLLALADRPQAVTLVDLTNDGIPDAVVAAKSARSASLQVLRGTADGGYAAPPLAGGGTCGNGVIEAGELCDDGNTKNGDGCSRTCQPELGSRLTMIAAADMDGDGNQDLVTIDAVGRVTLLLGDGAGRFASIRKLDRMRARSAIALGDVYGDGAADIVGIPRSKRVSALAVLANDGAGAFRNRVIATGGVLPGPQLLLGDFDRDGALDVAVATGDATNVAVLLNDGSGKVAPVGMLPLGAKLSRLAAADFDEDGWLDLLATVGPNVPPVLFRGSPAGSFGDGVSPADAPAGDVTIADVDDDGHYDLVACAAAETTACQCAYGTGGGAFAAAPPPRSAWVGRQLRSVAAVDLDGDGALDFVGVSRADDRAVVFFRRQDGTVTARIVLPTGRHPRALAVGDLNGDGRPDLVVGNEASNDLSVFLNDGQRRFTALPAITLSAVGRVPSAIAIGDLDGDGKLDVVVALQLSSNVALFRNIGGALAGGGLAGVGTLPTGDNPQGVALADVDGDGIPDIITVNRDGVPPAPEPTPTITATPTDQPTPDDEAPPDGATPDPDVATPTPTATRTPRPTPTVTGKAIMTGSLTLYRSTGTPGFASGYTRIELRSGGIAPQAVAVTDLNGDGACDLVVINSQASGQAGTVVTFLNDGLGGFGAPTAVHRRGREKPRALCIGDFDADGVPDVAVASLGTNDVLVLRGDGAGSWRRDERSYPVGKDPRTLACADVDADGKPDIVFGRMNLGDIDAIETR